jgi:hypothetical protein
VRQWDEPPGVGWTVARGAETAAPVTPAAMGVTGRPGGPAGALAGWLRATTPLQRDVIVYGCSALFSLGTLVFAGIPLYRQWGAMALGPYAAATIATGATARWWWGNRTVVRWVRTGALVVVLVGATLVPLGLEVVWASQGNAAAHVQPEVLVVEHAGVRADAGKDPYQVVDRNGRILIHQSAEPVYELYYPYLPGMVLFGFSAGSKVEARLTDARLQFLVFTAAVSIFALSRLRPKSDARLRAAQALTVLPTAALPLSTGGDDMPVVALMLLGLVALQRRRPVLAGLAMGAAASLKFTAWPLVLLALWVTRDRGGHRAVGRYLGAVAAVVVPVVVPIALQNPSAFVDNVVRFPLGLAGVASPAASALPGHLLVSAFPAVHRPYVVTVAALGAAFVVWRLWRHPPKSPADLARLCAGLMLAAIVLAPATRVGYLLYPANLAVWAWLLRQSETPGEPARRGARWTPDELRQSVWGTSYKTRANGVVPVGAVGETIAPSSQ